MVLAIIALADSLSTNVDIPAWLYGILGVVYFYWYLIAD